MMPLRFSLKNIRLFTFDVHNVLLTVRDGAVNQYARLARQHLNIESIDKVRLESNMIRAFQTLNQTHPGYGVHNAISSKQWWSMLVKQAFQNECISSNQMQLLAAIIYDEFAKGDMWIQHSQAQHVLKILQKKACLGIISNFDERLESLLEQHDLRSYFKFVLTPRTCGMYKPQEKIFSHAGHLAHVDDMYNVCHIGDDVRLDYRAALASHCQAVLLTKNEEAKQRLIHEHPDIAPEHVITQFDDFLQAI
jgi:REG-2-like HAD superfamily hydrolase